MEVRVEDAWRVLSAALVALIWREVAVEILAGDAREEMEGLKIPAVVEVLETQTSLGFVGVTAAA